jgi:hypothetical protein
MPALPPIGLADLHVHPSGNAVSAETARAVYAALRASGLQVAALTDHDRVDVAQALVARSHDERIPIELVVGEEITTTGGHLLGVGLTAMVPAGLCLADAVAAVHDQGGIAVVAHPLLPTHMAASARLLVELAEGDPQARPDALEAMRLVAAWVPGWRGRSGSASAARSPVHEPSRRSRGTSAAGARPGTSEREAWTRGAFNEPNGDVATV